MTADEESCGREKSRKAAANEYAVQKTLELIFVLATSRSGTGSLWSRLLDKFGRKRSLVKRACEELEISVRVINSHSFMSDVLIQTCRSRIVIARACVGPWDVGSNPDQVGETELWHEVLRAYALRP